jgi:hypothetical protein
MKKRKFKNDPFEIDNDNKMEEETAIMDDDDDDDYVSGSGSGSGSSISIKKYYKLVVFATRDIKMNEQLYTSHSQCEYLGCNMVDAQDVFISDFGYVQNYPRRYVIDCDPFDAEFRIVFDIDRSIKDDENEDGSSNHTLTFTWIRTSKIEDILYTNSFIDAQKDRMYQLKTEFNSVLNQTVTSKYERAMILQIHAAYTEAFELAYMYRYHKDIPTNTTTISKLTQTSSIQNNQIQDGMNDVPNYYDPLTEKKGFGITHHLGNWMGCAEGIIEDGTEIGKLEGFYQSLEFYYEKDYENTYMHMAEWLHSGSNFRAHYHEAAIHVPLQYVKDVKRVLYIGGGDNMVVHELLKYPNIELIAGMELDQQVSRSSMKYFGTTPSYHDPRV